MRASIIWQVWHYKHIQRNEGFDSMVGTERRWCAHCLWWHHHSVHLEDIPHGTRHRYVCMHCARRHIVEDLMEGWYDNPEGAQKTYAIEPGEDEDQ